MSMVSSASQSPVSTSIGPPSTISRAAASRSPKKPLQLAIADRHVDADDGARHRCDERSGEPGVVGQREPREHANCVSAGLAVDEDLVTDDRDLESTPDVGAHEDDLVGPRLDERRLDGDAVDGEERSLPNR
jgi:hypothetical protein